MALAVLLGDLPGPAERAGSGANSEHHRQGDAGGLPVQPPRQRCPPRYRRPRAARREFVIPDPPPASVLFVTGGSGITPVMSMLRTMARRGQLGTDGADVVHLHSAPTAADAMFAAELAELQRDHPGYRLTVRATRSDGTARSLPGWREQLLRLARPPDLGVRAGRDAGRGREGLGDRRVWWIGCTWNASPPRGSRRPAPVAPSPSRAAAPPWSVDAATSLLEAGERAGVQLPFGCRIGICHTCVVSLVDGRARDLRTGTEHEPGTQGADLRDRTQRRLRGGHLMAISDVEAFAHLTDADIEALPWQVNWTPSALDVEESLGEGDARYIMRTIASAERALEVAGRLLLALGSKRVGLVCRDRQPGAGQNHREHGDRPQRPARSVGLDERSGDPLLDLGVGHGGRRPSTGGSPTTSPTTSTPTSWAWTTTSATASCGSPATRPGKPRNTLNLFINGLARRRLRVGNRVAALGTRQGPQP